MEAFRQISEHDFWKSNSLEERGNGEMDETFLKIFEHDSPLNRVTFYSRNFSFSFTRFRTFCILTRMAKNKNKRTNDSQKPFILLLKRHREVMSLEVYILCNLFIVPVWMRIDSRQDFSEEFGAIVADFD